MGQNLSSYNSDKNNKKNVEHFYISAGGIIGIVFAIIVIFVTILYMVNHNSSSIKYLTSSTSPGFDLTYTPNL
jgi:hypothetical protein